MTDFDSLIEETFNVGYCWRVASIDTKRKFTCLCCERLKRISFFRFKIVINSVLKFQFLHGLETNFWLQDQEPQGMRPRPRPCLNNRDRKNLASRPPALLRTYKTVIRFWSNEKRKVWENFYCMKIQYQSRKYSMFAIIWSKTNFKNLLKLYQYIVLMTIKKNCTLHIKQATNKTFQIWH